MPQKCFCKMLFGFVNTAFQKSTLGVEVAVGYSTFTFYSKVLSSCTKWSLIHNQKLMTEKENNSLHTKHPE